MGVFNGVFPVLPGQEAAARAWRRDQIKDITGVDLRLPGSRSSGKRWEWVVATTLAARAGCFECAKGVGV